MRKIIHLFFIFFVLCGCSPKIEYLPSEIKTDTIYKSVNSVDSIYKKDSIFVNQYVKGDTVYKEKVKVKFRDRIKIKNDTIFKSRIDSVRIIVPVEKHLTRIQNTRMVLGDIFAIILSAIAATFAIRILLRRFKP